MSRCADGWLIRVVELRSSPGLRSFSWGVCCTDRWRWWSVLDLLAQRELPGKTWVVALLPERLPGRRVPADPHASDLRLRGYSTQYVMVNSAALERA